MNGNSAALIGELTLDINQIRLLAPRSATSDDCMSRQNNAGASPKLLPMPFGRKSRSFGSHKAYHRLAWVGSRRVSSAAQAPDDAQALRHVAPENPILPRCALHESESYAADLDRMEPTHRSCQFFLP